MDWHGNIAHNKLKELRVVFHIPVPVYTLNSAGGSTGDQDVLLRDAVFERYQVDGTVNSAVYDLETTHAAEYALLQTGEIHEYVETVKFDSADDSLVAKRAKVRDRFDELAVDKINELKKELKYWNYNEDVPA